MYIGTAIWNELSEAFTFAMKDKDDQYSSAN